MNPDTLLLRQVHPNFVQNGRPTSQIFRPTPKDEMQISVDNGDKISALDSFVRFTNADDCKSVGVVAVTHYECDNNDLNVIEDAVPYAEHCTIDFAQYGKSEIEKKAKILTRYAIDREWLYTN